MVISKMKAFGFTDAESKAYLSLLQHGPSTGYEVSKKSGIPKSKVYTVLYSLVQKGAVLLNEGESSSTYMAENPDDLLALLKSNIHRQLKDLESGFAPYKEAVDNSLLWSLSDYYAVLEKAKTLVRNAKESLLLQIWMDNLDEELENLILQKQKEGIKTLVILYDETEKYKTKLQKFYKHGFEDDKLTEFGKKWINLIVDKETMLYSTTQNLEGIHAIFTQNSSMVFFAYEYIMHDAYCLRLIDTLKDAVKDNFGEDMEKVRSVF